MCTHLRRRLGAIALLAVVSAAALSAAATAGSDVTRQRVALAADMPTASAVLTPLNGGPLQRDAGAFGGDFSLTPDRTVIRDGQEVDIYTVVWTFKGKRGNLVFRARAEWIDLGTDLNRDGQQDGIATAAWRVVRGTGQYAGATGGGRGAQLGLGRQWVQRYDGFLTIP
jgi:hypothetical protein